MILAKASLITLLASSCVAFQLHPSFTPRRHSSTLLQAKKMKNKQAELAKKMALAKKKAADSDGADVESPEETNTKLTDIEMKERNDRKRFDELLQNSSVSLSAVSSDGYMNKQQEEAEIDALRKGVDLLFEGDPAPTESFEELIDSNDKALGESGAKRLIPWLRNPSSSDYCIVICDPRIKSPEVRDVIKSLSNELPKQIIQRTIIITADSPAENRRFTKKSNLGNKIQLFSDEKRSWMRSFTALGEDRFSMTMFVLADERIQKLSRDMDYLLATKVVQNAVKAMDTRRL